MPAYRKKPVVIQAYQLPPADELTRPLPPNWFIHAMTHTEHTTPISGLADGGVSIRTTEGVMRAAVGDWIIQGVNGELYPCRPDVFAKTYEPA